MVISVSIPNHDRSKEEVILEYFEAKAAIEKIFSNEKNLYIQPSYHIREDFEQERSEFYYLGEAIRLLDNIDAVYFCSGWEDCKHCKAEHYICELYGVQRIEV